MTGRRRDPPAIARVLLKLAPPEWRDSLEGDLREERARRRARGQHAGWLWAVTAAGIVVAKLAGERLRRPVWRDAPRERRAGIMDGIAADIRQAARGILAHRGYALVAVLTLALGIGANTAVFNLANWFLFRPVPGVGASSELVTIGYGGVTARGPVSLSDLQALRAGTPALRGIAGYQSFELHVAPPGGVPARTTAEVVTGNYFDVLSGPVAIGRGFSDEEGIDPGRPAVVVVSHRLWQTAYGGAPDVLGRPLVINSAPFTIVGVAVRGFHGTSRSGDVDVWVPIAQHALAVPSYPKDVLTSRRVRMLFGLVGRMVDGATTDLVAAQVEAVRVRLAVEFTEDRRLNTWSFTVSRGLESRPWVRDRLSRALSLLLGIVALLLVLTCANVANLMLGRAAGRRGEIATRLALGASRVRIARLLLAESLLVSLAAGAVALAAAVGVGRLLEGTVVLSGLPPMARVEMDWRVFAFALAISSAVALVAGILPAMAGGRIGAATALREAGRSQTPGRRRARAALTTAQVAVSVTLLVGAALLTRSMVARLGTDPGFDPSRVMAFSVEPGLQGYGPRQEAFYRDLLERVRQTPGVRAAGIAWLRPYSTNAADTSFRPEGASEDVEISANFNAVSPGYFAALGLTIVEGRDFTEAEFQRPATAGEPVAILTESLARRTFGPGPAVGRRLIGSFQGVETRTVVGVVADTRQRRLTAETEDIAFEPFGQPFPTGWASVVVGLAGPMDDVAARMRTLVSDIDATLPIYDVVRLDAAIREQFSDDFLVMRLTATFALLATMLAAVGLYGVLARGVSERQREIGIRTALGARPSTIAGLVAREALVMLLAGVAIGWPVSWLLARFVESRLFGVERLDPVSFAGAGALVTIVVLVSALPAARRAARLDPARVLRA
jgi:predicted permease